MKLRKNPADEAGAHGAPSLRHCPPKASSSHSDRIPAPVGSATPPIAGQEARHWLSCSEASARLGTSRALSSHHPACNHYPRSVPRPPLRQLGLCQYERALRRDASERALHAAHTQPRLRLGPAQVGEAGFWGWVGATAACSGAAASALLPAPPDRPSPVYPACCSLKNKSFSRGDLATFGAEQDVSLPARALPGACRSPSSCRPPHTWRHGSLHAPTTPHPHLTLPCCSHIGAALCPGCCCRSTTIAPLGCRQQ